MAQHAYERLPAREYATRHRRIHEQLEAECGFGPVGDLPRPATFNTKTIVFVILGGSAFWASLAVGIQELVKHL